MPIRKLSLVSDETYHIFNRGVNKRSIFEDKYDYLRFVKTLEYYQICKPLLKFSKFLELTRSQKKIMLENSSHIKQVQYESYCLMPNHFHLLVKQNADNGISNLLRLVLNSYTKYFNIKHDRIGPLWQGQFKAVHVNNENQLLHVSRYIHLNPYSASLVKTFQKLCTYRWSSLHQYIEHVEGICDTNLILSFFKNRLEYKSFLQNHADYQRSLKESEHLLLDQPTSGVG